jgi:hypothetical protein
LLVRRGELGFGRRKNRLLLLLLLVCHGVEWPRDIISRQRWNTWRVQGHWMDGRRDGWTDGWMLVAKPEVDRSQRLGGREHPTASMILPKVHFLTHSSSDA